MLRKITRQRREMGRKSAVNKLSTACSKVLNRIMSGNNWERLEPRQMLSGSVSTTLYVDASSTAPTPDGTSWANAYPDLQQALSVATAGTTVDVAQGTYFPSQSGDRTATFDIINGVIVDGGFAGNKGMAKGIDPGAHDVSLYPAILSGDVGTPGDKTDNSYHVVTLDFNSYFPTQIDGFVITGGNASGNGSDSVGGGILIHSGSTAFVTNCTFVNDTAASHGGGAYAAPGSSPFIATCSFTGDIAESGGGYYSDSAQEDFAQCTFSYDTATNQGGGLYEAASNIAMQGCLFFANSAAYGGAMYFNSGTVGVAGSTFDGNTAVNNGGAIFNEGSSPQLVNCVMEGDSAGSDGGAIFNGGYYSNSDPTLINCTIAGDSAGNGGGAITDQNDYYSASSVEITNSIIYGDGPDNINLNGGGATIAFSDVEGPNTLPLDGTDISGDPLFNSNYSDLRPQSNSPVINAGDPSAVSALATTDILGNPRLNNGNVDMGAYEYSTSNPTLEQPDLEPQNLQTSQNTAFLGSTVGVSWDDVNIGSNSLNSNWVDAVYLSRTPQIDSSSILLSAVPVPIPPPIILAGTTLDPSVTVQLPGASPLYPAGTYYLIVESDIGNSLGESDLTNNVASTAIPLVINGKTIYVDQNTPAVANGITPDGTSWATAFPDIPSALAEASFGDVINVAQGTYLPSAVGDMTASLALVEGVTLEGGFGGEELTALGMDPGMRNVSAYSTVLSGDLNGDGSDISQHVVSAYAVDNTTVLDGFTISDGAQKASSIDGGGLRINQAAPTINDCTFTNNTGDFEGAAIYVSGAYQAFGTQFFPQITGCTFTDNSANYGSAIADFNSGISISGCEFDSNTAQNDGGAIYLEDFGASINFSIFSDNQAYEGGAIFNVDANPTISHDFFDGNTAQFGGAIDNIDSSAPDVLNCIFDGNTAAYQGGAILNSESRPTIVNCTFVNNKVDIQGDGGAVFSNYNSIVTIRNSILWGDNGGETGTNYSSSQVITFSDVQGGALDTSGNINFDPLYNDPSKADFSLQLNSPAIDAGDSTQAVDFGITFDSAGNPRIVDVPGINDADGIARVDMGAFEFQPTFTTPVQRPDLTPTITMASAPAPGIPYFGHQLNVSWSDQNLGTAAAAGWTDAVYLSTIPGINSQSILLDGSQTGSNLAAGGSQDFFTTVTLPKLTANLLPGTYYIVVVNDPSNSLLESNEQNNVSALQIQVQHLPVTIYVDANNPAANPVQDGTSWTTAFADLQSALAGSYAGDTILVAQGTYFPSSTGDPNQSFVMVNGVDIQGGYAGNLGTLNGIDANTRNISLYTTTLSGNIGGASNPNNQTYRIVSATNLDSASILDGFTITGSNYSSGGGVFISQGSPTLQNLIITGNAGYFGGGVYITQGSPTLTNCAFSGNKAYDNGGAVYDFSGDSIFNNCTFSGNSSGAGGAVFSDNALGEFTDCVFTNNTSNNGDGGAVYESGNGSGSIDQTFVNCLFTGNSADEGGGAYAENGANPSFINCTFSTNTANAGGALGIGTSSGGGGTPSHPTLINSILWGDNAPTEIEPLGTPVNVSFSDIQNGYAGSNGNISFDPKFVGGGSFALQTGSPAIDDGSNAGIPAGITTDLAGNPRVFNNTVDMGAYESQTVAATNLPDLEPQAVTPSAGPFVFAFPFSVSWSDANIGAVSAAGGYVDHVYLSSTPDISPTSVLLTQLMQAQLVAANGSVSLSANFTLPAGSHALENGTYYLVVETDAGNVDQELSEQNNFAASGPIQITHIPQTFYVDAHTPAASAAQDGTSWATAFATLQPALADALAGDSILVAQGTYLSSSTQNGNDSFGLVEGVDLAGGYAGNLGAAGGVNPNTRNLTLYSTILSGNIGGTNNPTAHSYSVVTAVNLDSSTILDGFTVTGGANGAFGGGLRDTNASPTIQNCIFVSNVTYDDGGAIFNDGTSSPTILNCAFNQNSSSNGGAIFDEGGSPVISGCTFSNDSASSGGAIYNFSGSPTLTDCSFSGNSASYGGAVYDTSSAPTFTNCTFSNNSSSQIGGAVYQYSFNSPSAFMNCRFTGNSSGNGGAIYFIDQSPIVLDCTFANNSASLSGGALYLASSGPAITNSLFAGNTAGTGGAVYIDNSSIPVIDNSTFTNNTASGNGGAIDSSSLQTGVAVTNSIFWQDGTSEIVDERTNVLTVTNSDVDGGYTGTGNIDSDPLFVGPDVGNYELQSGSPAIDEGDNTFVPVGVTTDLAGNTRVVNGIVDMGAYEFSTATARLANLEPQNVVASASTISFGQTIGVTWTDQNIGSATATAGWVDDIYLSSTPLLNSSSVLLGTQNIPAGALAAGSGLNLSTTVTLPPLTTTLPNGVYYIIIDTNATNTVAENNYQDNIAASSAVSLSKAVFWVSATGGDWNNPNNWSGGLVPGASDSAIIDVPGITVTVSTNVTVGTLTSQANIDVSGTLNISGATSSLSGVALPPGDLALWLRADEGVTTNGSNVTNWRDQSGLNHNATPQNGGATLVNNAIGGQPALQFNGSEWFNLAGQVLNSQQYTVFAVASDTGSLGSQNFRELFSDWSGSNAVTSVFLGTDTNQAQTIRTARFTDAIGGADQGQFGVGQVPSNQPFILAGVSGSTDASVYLDGAQMYDLGAPISMRNLTTGYAIGAQGQNAFENWQGDIAEVIVYNAALTPAQIAQVDAYLGAKYGLGSAPVSSASTISGSLTVEPGATLNVSGADTTFTATGATTIDGANISATGGAQLTLPTVTSYTTGSAFATLAATGSGSTLSLPNLTSLNGSTYNFFGPGSLTINAAGGGTVLLPAVQTLSTGNFNFTVSGAGSQIDLPMLTSFASGNGASRISATTGGVFSDPLLTSFSAVAVSLDATGVVGISQVTNFTDSSMTVSGQTVNFAAATDVDHSSFIANGGATITVPLVTNYNSDTTQPTFSASGAGSSVSFADLTTLNGCTYNFFGPGTLTISASGGGVVNLPAVQSLSLGNYNLNSSGAGSQINLPLATALASTNAASQMSATAGGKISIFEVTTISAFAVTLDATGLLNLSQITNFTDSSLTVTGQAIVLSAATDVDHSSFIANGGAKIGVPVVAIYSADTTQPTFSASGAGSSVSFADLTTLNGCTYNFFGPGTLTISASGGGVVNLPAVQSLSLGNYNLNSSGAGSQINLPLATALASTNAASQMSATAGGKISIFEVTTISAFAVTLDATGLLNLSQITNFTDSSLTVTGQAIVLSAATDVDHSSFIANGGATITVPLVTNYNSDTTQPTFSASGAGSSVSFPDLITLNGCTYNFFGPGTLTLSAAGGGTILLPAVQSLSSGNYTINATGTGSLISLPLVGSFISTNGESHLTASAGASIVTAPALSVTAVEVTLSPTGTIDPNSLTLNAASILDGSGTFSGSVFNLAGNVSPGGANAAGGINIIGVYTQGSAASLSVDIGGTTPASSYDQLVVSGAATIDGLLALDLISPFTPAAASSYTVISAGSLSGVFASITGALAPNNIELDPTYGAANFTLTANQVVGPFVTASSLGSTVSSPFGFIDLTFNKAINPATFVPGDVVFTGPGGAITVAYIQQLSSTVFRIGFNTQSADGSYSLVVGPNIQDFAGNQMDQNMNGISGEAADAYTQSFTVLLPDLTTQITSTAPNTAQFGDGVTLNWTDKNIGNAATTGGWVDEVFFSTSPTLNGSNYFLGSVTVANNPLAVNGTLNESLAVNLPAAAAGLPPGTYYLVVETDANNNLVEANEQNNLSATSAIQVAEPPLPDLATSAVNAPPSAQPGSVVTVTWMVANNGTAAASGPWSEQIFLATDAAGDNAILVGNFSFNGTLGANSTTARSANITIPPTALGNYFVIVKENLSGQVFETNTANNTAASASPLNVIAGLTLSLANHSEPNTAGPNATTATLSRNGDTSQPLSVTILNSDPTDVSVPMTVIIPAGQNSVTFPVGIINNNLVEPSTLVALTATASGVASGGDTLTVTNNVTATLTLNLNLTTIPENAANPAAMATLSTNDPSDTPLVVTLASNTTGKLTVPAQVTIPAGQTSVTFPVSVIDDMQIVGDANVTVSATAPGFVTAQAVVDVLDVHVPTLTLSLADSSISQNGGPQATTGTITFSKPAIAPFQILLHSSNIGAATVPSMILVTPGESSISFRIAAVNNGSALNQNVTITAMIVTIQGGYLNSTQVATNLTVVSVNGPALAITFPVAAISATGTATATVTRNNDTTSPLTVTLASSDTTHATVPTQVTIPAGSASATFTITGVDDMKADGEQYSQISASANGLAEGLATIGVTTVDLPDLTVSNVTSPTAANAGTQLQLSWTITNSGMYATVGSWSDQVFLDPIGGAPSTTPIDTVAYTGSPIPAGQSYTQSDTITLPTTTGAYVVRIVTDPAQTVEELSYNNNSGAASLPLNINAPYHATVTTSITAPVPNGTLIPLSGHATFTGTGQPAANVQVAVWVMVNGTRRQLLVTTDSSGNYATTFQPLEFEAGQYSVSADYPGVPNSPTQTTFTIVGMSANPSIGGTVRVVPNTPLTGQFTLTNLTNFALTGLTATAEDVPSDIQVQLNVPQTLPGSGQVTFSYSITADGSRGAQSSAFLLEVTTAQGAFVAIPINVIVTPLHAQLAANPGFLNAGMLVGSQTLVSFTVTNNGGAPTGPLQVLLPAGATFLSAASPTSLPSLAPGDSTTISLLLSPAASLALEQYTGTVVVNFTGGGLTVPFTFKAISGQTGNVQVLVDDYFTFNTPGSPRVANANVSLLDAYDNSIVIASGTTDSTGQVTLTNVPAGPYVVQVQAAGHNPYNANYNVTAGITNTDEIILPNQLVTYSWKVVPTEIQDQYSIKLQTTFVTNVPAPVVTITAPDAVPTLPPGGSAQIEITLTNHGLIAANDLSLNLPVDPEYTFTALTTNLGTLPAQSSVTVPVLVTYHPLSSTSGTIAASAAIGGSTIVAADGGGGSCTDFISAPYDFICDNLKIHLAAGAAMSVGGRACDANAVISGFGDEVVPGGPIFGGGTPASVATNFNCVKCLQAAGDLALNTALGLIPGVGPALQIINNPPKTPGDVIITIGGLVPGPIGAAFGLIGNANDIAGLLQACFGSEGGGGSASGPKAAAIQLIGDSAVTEVEALNADIIADSASAQTIINYYSYFFGSSDWLATTTQGATEQQWLQDFVTDTAHTSDGSINAADQAKLLATNLPTAVSLADAQEFLSRWNLTVSYYAEGITSVGQVPAGQSTDFIDSNVVSQDAAAANNAIIASQANGFTDPVAQLQSAISALLSDAENPAVCASVILQINQTATLTREAFAGSLTISNNEGAALTNIQVTLNITDASGKPANGEFFIETPGLSGALTAIDGTGSLAAGTSGAAAFTFIPVNGAANNGPTSYLIGGTITFTDPAGGVVTQTIYPSSITVYPQPNLKINYFLQRDVVGEDPSTPTVNIPSEPAVLGLLVTNTGAGEATNLSITTAQPQIVENAKGLLDTFQIIGTQVGNQQVSPSLTVDLGNIASGQTADADFLLTSALQGIFTNFSATFTHSDALGGLSTSLISSISTHDLVHAGDFNFPGSTGAVDYLVDDTANFNNTPDTIYFSNGTTAPVTVAVKPTANGTISNGSVQVTANVTSGWDYIQLPDPGAGFTLYKVVRSDGAAIPVSDQAWQTDRSFSPDGKSSVDNELHLLDFNSTGSYTLFYKPINAVPPKLVSLTNITSPQSGAVSSIDVTFSEPIDPTTFSTANLSLTLNGGANLITNAVTIIQDTPTTFTISGLAGLTAADGNYTLTVSAGGVSDPFGDAGSGSLSESWATGIDRPVVVSVTGITTPRNTSFDIANVTLSEPIVASSFTTAALSLSLNGGSNLIGSGVSITQTGVNTFQISGLASLTATPGTYVLTVNPATLTDAGGNSGVGSLSDSVVVDTTAPTILSLGPTPQTPRNVIVPVVDVTFSKPIDPSTFTYQNILFSNDGGPNLILPTITITQLSPTEFEIGNFENLRLPIDGTYTFTVSAVGVHDFAGNVGTGTASESWTLITSPPAAPSNLAITPDTGVSSSDGVTDTLSVVLSGSVSQPDLIVHVFDNGDDLGDALVTGQTFSLPLTLSPGSHNLTIYAVDAANNVSTTTDFNIFFDGVAPTVSVTKAPPATSAHPTDSVQITFSEPVDLSHFDFHSLTLSLNGGENLITSGVSLSLVSGNTYAISGLAALDGALGSYQLTIDNTAFKDIAGNVGVGASSASWSVVVSPIDTFTGAISSDFNNPGNWDQGFVPGSEDTAVINSGIVDVTSGFGVTTLNLNGGTIFWSGGNLAGNINIAVGAAIGETGSGSPTISGGTLTNAGDFQIAGGTVVDSDATTNTGLLQVTSGATLQITPGSLANLSGATLTGGSYEVDAASTLSFGGSVSVNAANVSLSGAGANFVDLAALATNSGSLTLENGASFTTAGGFTNSGSVSIDPTSTLTVTGNYLQASGSTNLGGTLNPTGGLTTLNGGSMQIGSMAGAGTLEGNLASNGAVSIIGGSLASPTLLNILTGNGSLSVGSASSNAYLRLAKHGGTSSVSSLTIAAGSTLDVTDNPFVINYGSPANDPVAAVQHALFTAHNGVRWNGTGLTSTSVEQQVADGIANNTGLWTLAYVDGNTTPGVGGVLANQILIQPEILGDTNFDGMVSMADLLVFAQNVNKTTVNGHPVGPADGDFNGDGIVSFADLLILSQNIGKVASQLPLEGSLPKGTQKPAIGTVAASAAAPTQPATVAPASSTPTSSNSSNSSSSKVMNFVAPIPALAVAAPKPSIVAVTDDAVLGVWNGASSPGNLLFSDAKVSDILG